MNDALRLVFACIGVFLIALALASCGRAGAETAPVPPEWDMSCLKLRLTPEILGARCENTEAVCYVTNGGMQCKFK